MTLKAGESFGGFISSKLNLAGLSFVVNVKNNSTINAYARRNCVPTTEYHDAKKLGIGMNSSRKISQTFLSYFYFLKN
jgi:hypothetical protein